MADRGAFGEPTDAEISDVERYGPVRAALMAAERRAAVRRRALRRLPFLAALPAVVVPAFMLAHGWARARGWEVVGRHLGMAMALSAVPLLAAALEAWTGVELRELARRWDALSGWQRGVIGTGAAVLALAVFGGIALAIAVRLAR